MLELGHRQKQLVRDDDSGRLTAHLETVLAKRRNSFHSKTEIRVVIVQPVILQAILMNIFLA
jgi:hypothetical protein